MKPACSLDELTDLALSNLSMYDDIDAMVNQLRPLIVGAAMTAPQFDVGAMLFRGRICDHANFVRELSYPPTYLAKLGRLNRAGSPMFYASWSRSSVFFETGVRPGDVLLVSRWRTTCQMTLSHIGYHAGIFRTAGSARTIASWDRTAVPHAVDAASEKKWLALAKLFGQQIAEGEEHKYKLSAAAAECLLGDPVAGILYPALAMSANADNVVLKPAWADSHLRFVGVERVMIESIIGQKLQVKVVDFATSPDGVALRWKGRGPNWTIRNQGEILRIRSTGELWQAFAEDGSEVDPD